MSILKSILHRYNTTSQDYDTLHPETEHAQVTDFGNGVLAHLLDSTLVSAVTAVSTGSLFGKLVEKLLEASGVQYNFTGPNGWYVCLGYLFGNLIIQGGYWTGTASATIEVQYPLTYPHAARVSFGIDVLSTNTPTAIANPALNASGCTYKLAASRDKLRWISVGF